MADQQFEDRTIKVNRVAKVVKGGRRFSFAALMVIGDGQGNVGLGYGKAKEAGLAVQKGIEEAKKNLFRVPLAGSTITVTVSGGTTTLSWTTSSGPVTAHVTSAPQTADTGALYQIDKALSPTQLPA